MFKKLFPDRAQELETLAKRYYEKYNISTSYNNFLYELTGYLQTDFDKTYNDLIDAENGEPLVDWHASVFDTYKLLRETAIEKIQFKPRTISGLDWCKKCGGDKFFYWQAQTRGNDEQTTTFKRCATCH
jgi:DNA-directed RNA polymerase subunit M/transcription elongation factor TFIIS